MFGPLVSRLAGGQWCPDCQRPCLPLGYGGNCPYGDGTRRIYAADRSSAIYYLLVPGDFSALNRLGGPKMYHFY